jgi:acetylornithine deacetylase/succinyl-diaminopimelate desuccinylase-like protein
VLKIEGGYRQYAAVVPERCVLIVTRLTMPGESRESLIADVRKLIDDLHLDARVSIAIVPPYYEPYRIDLQAPIARDFQAAYRAITGSAPHFAGHRGVVDANVFVAEGGIPTIVCGPRGARHHMAGEYVVAETLPLVARIYAETARRYLALDR